MWALYTEDTKKYLWGISLKDKQNAWKMGWYYNADKKQLMYNF